MSFEQWVALAPQYLILICGAFATLCGAVGWLYKAYKAVRKPHDDVVARIEKLALEHKHYNECLANDHQRLNRYDKDNKLTLRALTQLITHELDGNHIDKLAEVRDDINDHLINR